jgi:hypothetical protein
VLSFYTAPFSKLAPGMGKLILAATLAAFLRSFFGARLIKKVTLRAVRIVGGLMLLIVRTGVARGLL